jgi:threonine dehydrogenase-like Zn-dependent dehydrogenase
MPTAKIGFAPDAETADPALLGVDVLCLLAPCPARWDQARVVPVSDDEVEIHRKDGIAVVAGGSPTAALNALRSTPDPVLVLVSTRTPRGQLATALAARGGVSVVIVPGGAPKRLDVVNEPGVRSISEFALVDTDADTDAHTTDRVTDAAEPATSPEGGADAAVEPVQRGGDVAPDLGLGGAGDDTVGDADDRSPA